MERKDIFRKKAVDRVTSPEQLNDYIHVTSPSIWMLLTGIILILVGAIVWGIFGNLYTTVNGAGVVSNRNMVIYISAEDRTSVKEGMTVTAKGTKTVIREISDEPVKVTEDMNEYVLEAAGLKAGDWAYKAQADTELEDGIYSVGITVESVHPISFVVH